MPELVEHRVHPPLVRLDVAQHPDVAVAVDVDAEGVLALAVPGVEIALVEHVAHVETDAVVRADGERLQITAGEERIEIERAAGRRVLEERVVEVPRTKLVGAAPEARGEMLVELALPRGERTNGRLVDFVERGEQPLLIELAGGEREREVIAIPEVLRRPVPQARQLPDSVCDFGPDLLRGLPRAPPLL